MCSPEQVRFFVRHYPKSKMKDGGCLFNNNAPVGKNTISNYVKEVAEFTGFENWKRCTGYAPRKRCSEVMAEARIDIGEQCRMTSHKTLTAHQMCLMKEREGIKDQRRKAIMCNPIMEANNDKCDAMDDEKPSHKKMKLDSGEEPIYFLKKESANDYSSPSNAFAQISASSHGHFAQQSANVSGHFQPAFSPNLIFTMAMHLINKLASQVNILITSITAQIQAPRV